MSTQTLFRSSGAGRTQRVLGSTHCVKVTPADTDGAYLMFELEIPAGGGAPMHRHAVDTECFYVLEGTLQFDDGEHEYAAPAGAVCFLPAGGAHAFRNDGPAVARAVVVASPGREALEFFDEIDAAIGDAAPDAAEVGAIAARHGLSLLPPQT